ncbi:hypothetical protein [Kitasatospora sp. NPDC058218]|uniref:hypothetical protein n=1 Tax=Kitasatospora sp. NPDC058218 TaxID=3346385 RepID=UPI0036DADF51
MRTTKRTAQNAGLALAGGLALTACLATLTGGTAAQASQTSVPRAGATATSYPTLAPAFTLCSRGSYSSYAVFPKRSNLRTATARPGTCISQSLKGGTSEQVVLYGIRPDGSSFKIASDSFDTAEGERVNTLNTPDDNDWETF